MKLALVGEVKTSPKPKMSGLCPFCKAKVISKCGNIKIWHWAHYSKRDCDTWWENETEWHRTWKEEFPISWQEVIHYAVSGEKHIADVKTNHNCIIEFQHSPISIEERFSRDDFYTNLVWVVDGLRRKRDRDQFFTSLNSGIQITKNPLLIRIHTDKSRLVREWVSSRSSVFFDFGEKSRVWWLIPYKDDNWSYVIPFSRESFIDSHLGKNKIDFNTIIKKMENDIFILLEEIKQSRQSRHKGIREVHKFGLTRNYQKRRRRRF